MLLQVGFKSLSYEMQEQKPAYDSISLFGNIPIYAKKTYRVLDTTGYERFLVVTVYNEKTRGRKGNKGGWVFVGYAMLPLFLL